MNDKANTPEEILDLVDEDDNVIDKVKKGMANSDPKLIHREVAIILVNKKGEVLLQQRSHKKKVFPGMWTTSCAGHVPSGESPEETAHRELQEELGFNTKLKFFKKFLRKEPNETHFSYWFWGTYRDEKITIESEEVEGVDWVSREKLEQLIKDEKITKVSGRMIKEFWKSVGNEG